MIDFRSRLKDRGAGRGTRTATIGIAWHHTAAFYPAAKLTEADEVAHILMIEQYHISLGYGVFAYHGIAFASGRAYLTGNLDALRSHVASRNHELIGFVVAGDYSNSSPPPLALRALAEFRVLVTGRLGALPERGHGDWALPQYATSCPGAQRALWIPKIAEAGTDPPPPDQEEDDMLKYFPVSDLAQLDIDDDVIIIPNDPPLQRASHWWTFGYEGTELAFSVALCDRSGRAIRSIGVVDFRSPGSRLQQVSAGEDESDASQVAGIRITRLFGGPDAKRVTLRTYARENAERWLQ